VGRRWRAPITLSGVGSSTQLLTLSLSSDGLKLAVCDYGGKMIYELNPSSPATVNSFAVPQPSRLRAWRSRRESGGMNHVRWRECQQRTGLRILAQLFDLLLHLAPKFQRMCDFVKWFGASAGTDHHYRSVP
jgi:hypothetical protein